MSRREDINELFNEIREILSYLSKLYEDAKKDPSITKIDRVKVKSALEHLRSILDYSAMDTYFFVYNQLPPKQVCFPYGKDESKFRNSLTALSSNIKYIHLESEGREAGRGERLYFTIEESAVILKNLLYSNRKILTYIICFPLFSHI